MPCVQKSTKCFGNLTHSSKHSKQYIFALPPCHKSFPGESNFFLVLVRETTGLQQKEKSNSAFTRFPNMWKEGGEKGTGKKGQNRSKKGHGHGRHFGRGWQTSGSCWHYLEPLELLLALHRHGWGRGVRVAWHHLAAVGLHGRGVVVAAVHGGDGRPVAARALRHGRHLPRQTARQAWPRGREHRASLASQEQHYNQGSRKELVGALIMTANNFTQQLSSHPPNTAKPSLQTHSKHRLSTACTLSGCPVCPLT